MTQQKSLTQNQVRLQGPRNFQNQKSHYHQQIINKTKSPYPTKFDKRNSANNSYKISAPAHTTQPSKFQHRQLQPSSYTRLVINFSDSDDDDDDEDEDENEKKEEEQEEEQGSNESDTDSKNNCSSAVTVSTPPVSGDDVQLNSNDDDQETVNLNSTCSPSGSSQESKEEIQEQEQQQEQDQEQEQEQEQEIQEYDNKKYSRDSEQPEPWPLSILSQSPSSPHLYPCSEFSITSNISSITPALHFPEDLLMSNNYFKKKWIGSYRRLKNVIVVLEWIPDKDNLKQKEREYTLSSAQEEQLKTAFQMFDLDGKGSMTFDETLQMLKAVDIDFDEKRDAKRLREIFTSMDKDGNGKLEFGEVKKALVTHSYYNIESGRYFACLSLLEAEHLRAVLHMKPNLFSKASIALHIGSLRLDATDNFIGSNIYQRRMAMGCLKFIDSQSDFSMKRVSMLLRALQIDSEENRRAFYLDVRSCRRRRQLPWELSTLAMLFYTPDEYHLLSNRAIISRVITNFKQRGITPYDAFKIFDHDHDGSLKTSELYGGLEWLKIDISASQLMNLAKSLDSDGDGFINQQEFLKVFDDGEAFSLLYQNNSKSDLPMQLINNPETVAPKAVPGTDLNENRPITISEEALKNIAVRVVHQGSFFEIWTSRGTNTPQKASIWKPKLEVGATKMNTRRICVGHYVISGFSTPSKKSSYYRVQLEDMSLFGVQESKDSESVIAKYFPHPIRFRQVWNQPRGQKQLFVWAPVPPSDKFVYLGMVATNADEPPPLNCVHCVPVDWVAPTKVKPTLIWDGTGVGGRPGSLWEINSMRLFAASQGNEPPTQIFYDIEPSFFVLADRFKVKVTQTK
eukprot:c20367_g1_i1.p1 GENE.c20367_g1_i1~~c20367_g1_i1.p1  ORF type:complete len:993 (+),score=394.55 c20367_g1_i1:430-2979(+)